MSLKSGSSSRARIEWKKEFISEEGSHYIFIKKKKQRKHEWARLE